MKTLFYKGKKIAVPESINGRKLRSTLGIKKDRTVYVTDLGGKSSLVSDGKDMYVRDGQQVGDLPRTVKG